MPDWQESRGRIQTSSYSSPSSVLELPRQERGRTIYMSALPQVRAQRFAPAPEIWGQYNNYRSTALVRSAILHIVIIGLLLATSIFGHQIVQEVKPREIVTLIAPSPDSYALPTSKKEVSGGGGGGDRSPLPAPKGRLPKLDVQQITPPQIVLHNDKPKLTAQPTVVIPPQVHMAMNNAPSLGIPTAVPMPAAPPSNGTGSGGGIGSGSNGGVGVGHGAGVGAGSGGGIGGGVYKVGGGRSASRENSGNLHSMAHRRCKRSSA